MRDELSELAETFNGMLARIEASVERERRCTTNAAHELVTPVATLRSAAEVALRRERSAEAYRAALGTVLDVADEMRAVVDGLLALARSQGAAGLPAERVELGPLASHHADRCRGRAEERGTTLRVQAAPGVFVMAPPAALSQVAASLLDNAVKYTPQGGVRGRTRFCRRCSGILHRGGHRGRFHPRRSEQAFRPVLPFR